MDTVSVWKKTAKNPVSYQPLSQDIEVDVAIVGGGITGVTAAQCLMKAGKKVAIIEAENIGGVTTSSSTGNLYIAVQPYYQNIISKFDLETATVVAQSRKFAMDYIENNVNHHNLDCNFSRRPWFAYIRDENNFAMLENEINAFKKMGFDIQYTSQLPLPLKFTKAAVMENQARFHPLKYVLGLAADLQKKGCYIFENTRIIHMNEKDVCTLETAAGNKIIAKKTILATHTPIGVNITQLFTAAYRSYVVSTNGKKNAYPEGHFWNFDETHYAICTHAVSSQHPELLMIAGSHHKVGQNSNTNTHYAELEKVLKNWLQADDIAYRWSAQHYQSADDVPYIGLASRFARHTYMATGFFADGLVYGTAAGILLSDIILKNNNTWMETYQSNRLTLIASAKFLAKEDTNYLLHYYKDIPQKEERHFTNLKPGEAKIAEIDREKWAVYKDENKKLHIVSAVCTHMKCLVNWNAVEKTWDCPCHGSRFTTDGEVIEGPAQINLKKKEEE